jgi:uncharacterized RDD family membrane protein YckC
VTTSAGTRRHVAVVPKEARAFQGQVAGVISRLLAAAVDVAAAVVILGVVYVAWAAALFVWKGRRFVFPTVSYARAFLVGAAILVLMLARAWSLTGRSPGGRLMGLRVVSRRGVPVGGGVALVRALLSVAVPIQLLWCALDPRRRAVTDVVLRTRVIYDWVSRGAGRSEGTNAESAVADGRASEDALGPGVDVAAPVANEPDQGDPQPAGRLDRQ